MFFEEKHLERHYSTLLLLKTRGGSVGFFNLPLKIFTWTCIEPYFPLESPHCVKSVRIRSYSGPHFPAFGLNTIRYSVSLRIQSKCGKMQTRVTPNTHTFYAVPVINFFQVIIKLFSKLLTSRTTKTINTSSVKCSALRII